MDVKKVLVVGGSDCKKTEALEHICRKVVNTVAMDYGNTVINDTKIHLFSPPADEKFGFMKDVLSKNVDGVLIFANSKSEVESLKTHNILKKDVPYVIFPESKDLGEPLNTLLKLMSPINGGEVGMENLCHS